METEPAASERPSELLSWLENICEELRETAKSNEVIAEAAVRIAIAMESIDDSIASIDSHVG